MRAFASLIVVTTLLGACVSAEGKRVAARVFHSEPSACRFDVMDIGPLETSVQQTDPVLELGDRSGAEHLMRLAFAGTAGAEGGEAALSTRQLIPIEITLGEKLVGYLEQDSARTLGEVLDDTLAEIDIRRRLEATDQSNRFEEVAVTVRGGFVLLGGVVASVFDKREAESIAWSVASVDDVANELAIGARVNGGADLDTQIRSRVRAALVAEETIQCADVEVSTHDAVVYLLGIARSEAEIRQAAEVASQVEGVSKIVSFLKVDDRKAAATVSIATQDERKVTLLPDPLRRLPLEAIFGDLRPDVPAAGAELQTVLSRLRESEDGRAVDLFAVRLDGAVLIGGEVPSTERAETVGRLAVSALRDILAPPLPDLYLAVRANAVKSPCSSTVDVLLDYHVRMILLSQGKPEEDSFSQVRCGVAYVLADANSSIVELTGLLRSQAPRLRDIVFATRAE